MQYSRPDTHDKNWQRGTAGVSRRPLGGSPMARLSTWPPVRFEPRHGSWRSASARSGATGTALDAIRELAEVIPYRQLRLRTRPFGGAPDRRRLADVLAAIGMPAEAKRQGRKADRIDPR
jgi:hypothetical protein